MRFRVALGAAALAIGVTVGAGAPLLAQRPALAMLGELERGSWELRMREAGGRVERICLRDARRLIQLRHPADNCEPLVVSDTPGEVTVQYTCRGKGYGRTQIRRESNRLIQIDSQGIADGQPFAFSAEARRVGDCAA
jgi:hypothetical protein